MEIRFKERMADVFIKLSKPIINKIASREFNIISTGEKIDKKREPFILVSNHFNDWDSFIVMKNIKYNIRFLANQIVFKEQGQKSEMGLFARIFLKLIGTLNVDEIEKSFDYLKHGYAIGMFPEGAATFHGATLKIRKETGAFIKEANVDVVAVKQCGGYLSHPRWANHHAKYGVIHTCTSVIIKKEELADLTPLKINNIITKAISSNDYDFQKEHMIKLDRIHRAEGIERVLYYCNKC
ncbi:MAG: 1-acyl-sn-glycerol-3-phosphate acyltransferase, partial [Bacilli bacterium]|nr:1-acyl-sn-glycerol-3-phosphate acyltransferase [Bacilli bacterium]